MTKSHVSLEQKRCRVCCNDYDTDAILLDKRLRESMDHHTVTGWGLCPTCQELFDDGFVALVEADPDKSPKGDTLKPEEAYRTGRIFHMRREAYAQNFDVYIPPEMEMVFIDKAVGDMLTAAMPENKPE